MQTIIARPETAAELKAVLAEAAAEARGIAARMRKLADEAERDPSRAHLQYALVIAGVDAMELAARIGAQEPTAAMFAAVESARQEQCRTCPLLRAQVVRLPVQPRRRAATTA